jgi:hypothetical protein
MSCPSSRTRIPDSGRSLEWAGRDSVTVDILIAQPAVDFSTPGPAIEETQTSLAAASYMADTTSSTGACSREHARPARKFYMNHTYSSPV